MPGIAPIRHTLVNISPKAYEHPADRAATAALASIPMMDRVVRKLIEFGYERAFRDALLGNAIKVGPDQLPEVWESFQETQRTLDMPEQLRPLPDPDAVRQRRGARGGQAGGGRQLGARGAARPRRAEGRAGSRDGPHPLRARALPDRAAHPHQPGRERAPAVAREPAPDGRALRAARVVARRRALLGPGGRAGRPRPHRGVPHADDDRRRAPLARPRPRSLHAPVDRVPRSTATPSTASRASSATWS